MYWYCIAELGVPPPFSVELTAEEQDDLLYLMQIAAPIRTGAAWWVLMEKANKG